MASIFINRLTIVGPAQDVERLDERSKWMQRAGAAHPEMLECWESRRTWQFETREPPLKFLKRLSSRWPGLTFLLDYDEWDRHQKGLAKIKQNQVEHYEVQY